MFLFLRDFFQVLRNKIDYNIGGLQYELKWSVLWSLLFFFCIFCILIIINYKFIFIQQQQRKKRSSWVEPRSKHYFSFAKTRELIMRGAKEYGFWFCAKKYLFGKNTLFFSFNRPIGERVGLGSVDLWGPDRVRLLGLKYLYIYKSKSVFFRW